MPQSPMYLGNWKRGDWEHRIFHSFPTQATTKSSWCFCFLCKSLSRLTTHCSHSRPDSPNYPDTYNTSLLSEKGIVYKNALGKHILTQALGTRDTAVNNTNIFAFLEFRDWPKSMFFRFFFRSLNIILLVMIFFLNFGNPKVEEYHHLNILKWNLGLPEQNESVFLTFTFTFVKVGGSQMLYLIVCWLDL